ncbi:MAG: TdeIII family type II restriction endonuclease [Flavobacteriaceae bacterium]
MTREERVAKAIKDIIEGMMNRVMNNVLVKDPFIKEKHHSAKPLYAALVPDEIFKGSHFERRFVTPFGGVWEKLAQVVAIENHGKCELGYTVNGTVGDESLRRIQEVLNTLEHQKGKDKQKPNWAKELEYVQQGGGNPIPVSVVCDVFVENTETDTRYAFELKGPLPNSDQTKVSKEKLFKLRCMDNQPVDFAYYALPYNPYGKKEDYKWSFPLRWFDMQNDDAVLIGNEFWELIGGKGTYKNFITEINKLGKEYKEQIYREFLEIEPPKNQADNLLK